MLIGGKIGMKLITAVKLQDYSQPDPYMIEANGKFYIYATGNNGVNVYRSDDLFGGYEYLGKTGAVEGKKEYWAPSVIELDGKFYMYVSCMPEKATDTHEQAMFVMTADKPEGPFENAKQILQPFSIDSHIVKNDAGLFLFYSMNDYQSAMGGTYIVVDRMLDPFTPEGKPVPVIRPSLKEELWAKARFRPDQDWYTIEGAFYFRKETGTMFCTAETAMKTNIISSATPMRIQAKTILQKSSFKSTRPTTCTSLCSPKTSSKREPVTTALSSITANSTPSITDATGSPKPKAIRNIVRLAYAN